MRKKVYLCGGFRSGWQRKVIQALVDFPVEWFNPADQKLGEKYLPLELYSPLDEIKIRECDIVFAYLEASNPVIINIALELGFAKGLGKNTVLVNEWTEANIQKGILETLKPNGDWFKTGYLEMLIDWCDFIVTDINIGIEILKKLCKE